MRKRKEMVVVIGYYFDDGIYLNFLEFVGIVLVVWKFCMSRLQKELGIVDYFYVNFV